MFRNFSKSKSATILGTILSAIFIAIANSLGIYIIKHSEGVVRPIVLIIDILISLILFIMLITNLISLITYIFGKRNNAKILEIHVGSRTVSRDAGDSIEWSNSLKFKLQLEDNSILETTTDYMSEFKSLKIGDNAITISLGKIKHIDISKTKDLINKK